MDTSNTHSPTNRVVDKARDTIERAANQAIDKGTDLAHTAAEKGAEFKKAVVQKGEQALKSSQAYIKDNPNRSVLAALGIGMLIGGAAVILSCRAKE